MFCFCHTITGEYEIMIAQRTFTTKSNILHEAAQVVEQHSWSDTAHWACEVCGMLHTGSSPDSCESCGATDTFTALEDESTEIGSRW